MNKVWGYFFPSSSSSSTDPQNDNTTKSNENITVQQQPSTAPPQQPEVKIEFGELDVNNIIKESVEGVPEAFMLYNIMTQAECEQFLVMIEKIGAKANADNSETTRNASNSRGFGISDCKFWRAPEDVMNNIWARVGGFLPSSLIVDDQKCTLVTEMPLNEKFRYYCYDAGYVREKHFDGAFIRKSPQEGVRIQSHFTLLIYLNNGFDGGETTFYPGGFNSLPPKEPTHKEVKVNPKMGSGLVFRHTGPNSPLHEGSVHNTTDIRKCLLRSDVMYSTTL